jgi:hypothetical protein
MPQRPSVGSSPSSAFSSSSESSNRSKAIATLHPVVQAALENLDIQLEEELLRYRRSRHSSGETWRNKLRGQSEQTATSIPLGAVSYATNPDGEAIAIRPDTAEALAKIADRFSLPAVPSPEPLTHSEPEITPEITFDATTWNQTTDSFLTDLTESLADQSTPDLTQFSTRQPTIVPPQPPSTSSANPLANPSANPAPDLNLTPEDSLLDTLLTPLGIGSMLLLLVSSATLGFAMMNPANLSFLANLGKSKSATTAPAIANAETGVSATDSAANPLGDRIDTLSLSNLSVLPSGSKQGSLPAAPPSTLAGAPNPDAATLANAQTGTANAVPTLPTAPNLVGSLSQSLSTVPIYNTPPADISEAASAAPSYSAPSYSAPAYSAPPRISYVAPAPRAAAPPATSPQPYTPPPAAPLPAEPAQPETIVRSEAAPTDLDRAYHVDTPYLGDPVLGQAREEAPDAYVYNGDEGANIRASFATEAEAESYSQKLEEQGLSTSVQVGDAVQ